MTLLESIVAFVVLTLVGIACLDLSRGAMQLEHRSAEWTQAVAQAESAMAAATEGAAAADGLGATVLRRPWRTGVDLIEVSVPLPDGGVYRLERLAPRSDAARSAMGLTGR
jgi:hypothetical protein